jgi:hypothetical protein
MRIGNVIPKIGGFAALLMALDFAISDFVHPWFAVTWGIIIAICLFRTEIISWWRESRVKLSPQVQFGLALLLVLVAVITTHWTALGWQDMRQWGLVVFTLPLYWRGLAWAWLHLTHRGISHS